MTNNHSACVANSDVEIPAISDAFSLDDKIACLSVVVVRRPPRPRSHRKLQAESRTSPATKVHSKQLLLALILAVVTAAGVSAINSHAATRSISDPRKCSLNDRRSCARQSVVRSLRIFMAAKTGHPWSGHGDIQWGAYNLACVSHDPKLLLWACTWKASAKPDSATVRFWATSTGWYSRVTVQ